MQNVNYQAELEKIIKENQNDCKVPTLLLHSCCGPCSSYVLTYLHEYFRITLLYYNPNIYPKEEFDHRLSEQKRLLGFFEDVSFMDSEYDHQDYLDYVKGLEGEPEGGARCRKCFELRLARTAQLAHDNGFDYFATTLTISPHKNALVINTVGKEQEGLTGSVIWLPGDFKKKDGYKKSIELSKKYDLYRQDYCGCEFAK
ncbi:MAG: epoxyqueuosine reductase QueH [Lachnospiraceae bacterium]|nr:epoxyqueuosine reductase QueH [Lachnospiraceae bacterium]